MFRLTALIGAALVVGATVATAASSAAGDEPTGSVARFARIDRSLFERSGPAAKWLPASMSDPTTTVMLELSGQPVAVAQADAQKKGSKLTPQQKAAIRADLKGKQDGIKGGIQKAGGDVVGQLQDAYNGVLVSVPLEGIADLAALPGVTAVHSVPTYVPANERGAAFVDAPQAWGAGFNRTGKGVKVASIDSGTDYTHANFGGPGTVAAYDAARANGTKAPDPALVGPSAPKVKGGFDFVGDDYNAASGPGVQPVPHPDPNPLDCNQGTVAGHGSHTAGTIAGFGVLDGKTYEGPYNATTISDHAGHWTIGPGVAPNAELYSYRVFGCSGSSAVVSLAIDQAVKDGVDVINMSLGGPFGGQNDPTAVAANNAAAAGITVIASAGNSGQNGYMVGSPSTADRVLSVAAEDGTTPTYPGAHFALKNGKALDAINANGATFADNTSLPVVVVRNSSGGVSLGCSVTDFQAAGVQGKLAVVVRGTCGRVSKAIYGQQAGAKAVAMINNAPGLPPFEGKITSNPDTGEAADVTIPFFGIDPGTAPGLTAATGVMLVNKDVANVNFKQVASFSSGGPRSPDSAFKPEVSAPGVSVVSTGVGTGNGPATESGTSMAAPMTAGVAALVKEAHPTWTPDQVKAAIMNTADPGKTSTNIRVAGNGTVQADRALAATGLATTADHLDSLSFGHVPAYGGFSTAKTFTITNTGSSPVSYSLSSSSSLVTVEPTTVTVAAGQSKDVTATISLTAADVAALPAASTFANGLGQVPTFRGAVTATPNDGSPSLRVPFLLAPRGLSNVAAGALAPYRARGTSNAFDTSVTVSNKGVHAGDADFYAWGIHDAKDTGLTEMDIRDVGVQSFADGTIVFAINNYGRVANAAQNEFDVAIDTQHNGKPDFFVVGVDLGAVLTGDFDGRMGAFLFDAKTGDILDVFAADAPMNGSTLLLSVPATELGLHAANADFDYSVTGFSLVPGDEVDSTGVASYDTAKPGVSSGAFAHVAPGQSATVPLWLDKDKFQSAPALGWLAVTLDDVSGAAQADEIPLGTVK